MIRRIGVRDGKTLIQSDVGLAEKIAPASPSRTFADLGSYQQLTELQAAGHRWTFAEAPVARILLWNLNLPNNDPEVDPYEPVLFSTQNINTVGNVTTLTFTDAVLGSFVVQLTFDPATGAISVLPTLTPGAGVTGLGFRIWALDVGFLKVNPAEVATKEHMNCLFGEAGGMLLHNVTQVLPVETYPNGYRSSYHTYSKPYPQAPVGDIEGNQVPSFAQCVYLYHRTKNCGLLFTTTDTEGRAKQFTIKGDGSTTEVYVRIFPPNNLGATSWTPDYQVKIIPVSGRGWFAGAKAYRSHIESLSPPWITGSDPIEDRDDSDLPEHFKALSHIYWLSLSVNSGDDPDSDIDDWISVGRRDLKELRDASEGTILCYLYAWGYKDQRPDIDDPIDPRVISFVYDMQLLYGIKFMIYNWPYIWSPASQFAIDNPTLSDYVILDPGQLAVSGDGSVNGSDDHTVFYANFRFSAARTLIIQSQLDIINGFQDGGVDPDGIYDDAMGGPMFEDNRSTLPSASKGAGAADQYAGVRTFLNDSLTSLRAVIPGLIKSTEFPDETLLGPIILFSPWDTNTTTLVTHCPFFAAVYGERFIAMDFNAIDSYRDEGDTLGPLTQAVDALIIARMYTSGKVITLANFQLEHSMFYPDTDDPLYAGWLKYRWPLLRFIEDISNARITNSQKIWKYHRSRRLAHPDGCWDSYMEESSFYDAYVAFASNYIIPGPDFTACINYSDESGFGVLLTVVNFRTSGESDFQIALSRTEYPEIGSGLRYLYQIEANGDETLLGKFYGPIIYKATIPALTAQYFEIRETI